MMMLRLDNKPRTHDYRKSMWGHALHDRQVRTETLPRSLWAWITRKPPEHRVYLTATGHGDVRQGDFVLIAMQSGKTARWKATDVKHFRDPDGMFDLRRADFVDYLEDTDEGMAYRDRLDRFNRATHSDALPEMQGERHG